MTAVLHAAITVPVADLPDQPMTSDRLLTENTTLPRDPSILKQARHWLADILTAWNVPDDDADNAVLLLSEILANSVLHAGGDDKAEVWVTLWGASLKISVSDPDGNTAIAAPSPRDSAEHGRGLMIVDALAHRYGTHRTPAGKCFWVELFIGGGA